MANIINTQIQIESDNPKVFQFLLKWFEGVEYKEYTDTMFIFNKLYSEGKYDRTDYVDKIGTKWCYPTDWDDEGYDDWNENVRDSLYESKSTLMNTAKDTVTSTHLTNS